MTWTNWSPDPSGIWSSLAYSTICRWFDHKPVSQDDHQKCSRCGALRFQRY